LVYPPTFFIVARRRPPPHNLIFGIFSRRKR